MEYAREVNSNRNYLVEHDQTVFFINCVKVVLVVLDEPQEVQEVFFHKGAEVGCSKVIVKLLGNLV